ncbi:MAG: hypothetical protein KJP08_00995 [Gammaproteobacteria bacterium]|nr:hypothetical protein [Gammaproteobacteria bacterium]NNF50560.1 hypothetical protein [Woeseiaceae bacterium]
MKEGNPQPLRLRRKHGEGRRPEATAEDGARLVRAQSLRAAVTAGLITFILFCIGWAALSAAADRVFPWMTVVYGIVLGLVIRSAGRGVDWRFPLLAAMFAVAGSILGNIALAASTTAAEFGTGTLSILQAITSMTLPLFFEEVWSVADGFFTVVAAGFAAFLAPRRLTRRERFALRLRQEASDRHQ